MRIPPGTDYFYITPGDHTYNSGNGSDYYFVELEVLSSSLKAGTITNPPQNIVMWVMMFVKFVGQQDAMFR